MPLNLQDVPRTAPWLDLVLGITLAACLTWLALRLFVAWRRGVTNLTPVTAPSARADAQPDFLRIDGAAREAALARGDAFAGELDSREEARQRAVERTRKATRLASLMSLFMAIFSLATLVSGAIWQVTWVGTVWERYSADERLFAVMRTHPFAFTVSALVITYHVVSFVVERPWRVQD